eukprot:9210446-Ditylum_brightwellii.AAC.1
MQQNKINKIGMIVEKDRLTHNQSYEWSECKLVNSRVDKEALLPCKFTVYIKRLVNWAVTARKKYPNGRTLSTKADYKLT